MAAISGAFVVNGSPTQTAMADRGGARSQIAQLAFAGVVLVVLLFLTRPLQSEISSVRTSTPDGACIESRRVPVHSIRDISLPNAMTCPLRGKAVGAWFAARIYELTASLDNMETSVDSSCFTKVTLHGGRMCALGCRLLRSR